MDLENSPVRWLLPALLSLVLVGAGHAGSAEQVTDPVEPELVIVDATERAYTVFIAIPPGLPPAELENLGSQAGKQSDADVVPWKEFFAESEKVFDARILRDDYPGLKAREGIVELLLRYAGTPFGLTWNGGIAFTHNDYEFAKRTYRTYEANPEADPSARPSDPRADPVDPRAHLGPLLGWN